MDHQQNSNCPASNIANTYFSCTSGDKGFQGKTYGSALTGSTGIQVDKCFNTGRNSQVCVGADVSHEPHRNADVGANIGFKYKF